MRIESQIALVDTNILVTAFLPQNANHEKAKALVEELAKARRGAISLQNVIEFCRVMTEKYGVPENTVKRLACEITDSFYTVNYGFREITGALEIKQKFKAPFFDALIAATMETNGITEVFTSNVKDFRRIPWISVRNPFE